MIFVAEKRKAMIARNGAYKLFGRHEDPHRWRTNLDDRSCIERFDAAWSSRLGDAILNAPLCSADEVLRRLTESQRRFCDRSNEHREFRLYGLDFIAELAKRDDQLELVQLWWTRSSDHDPCLLFVSFENKERRQRWNEIAAMLRRDDEELALEILEDFMRKVERALDR